jgi:putative transposase
LVLVKPATVIGWHRKGFRTYWRWRLRRSGRPKMKTPVLQWERSARLPAWRDPSSKLVPESTHPALVKW